MRCGKCGAEIEESASFCPKCGERQKKPALSGGMKAGFATAGGIVLAAIAAAVIFFAGGKGNVSEEQKADEGKELVKETETDETQEKEGFPEEELPVEPLYYIEDVAVIDTGAVNHTPGAKETGMNWDSSLFYWLEDADTTSSEDGNIARCRLTRTLLRDAQSGALIQYEIYSDPDTGNIYKIVSIEKTAGGLKLTDWYYLNGQPNFVFQREDSVYTPTYATIDKVGERFYFNNDVMVRWRMIHTPGEVGEYTLAPRDTWYSQGDYFAESEELRQIYDATELRILNAACNTYEAITAGGNIGMVQGYLQDTVGNGIAGKTVKVYRVSDNALLYETVTDDSGQYVFFVYLDDTACYLEVEADDRYREMMVQGVSFAPSTDIYTYGLTMHKNSGDEYPVALHLYSCMDVVSDDDGTTTGGALQAVTATIREGAGNYDGEPLCTVETQNGELAVNLPSGVYTVQFHTEGYLDGYKEVEVMEAATVVDAYIIPGLAETQTGVILTWDSDEVDLDLTLFTPYQAAGGDMAHIGGSVDWDGNGNMLVADNKSKCEVMFINSGVQGSFKLYVNNYTDSVAGNYVSDALYRTNAHVYIYNSNGFVADYTIPLGQSGVVWEVAEINGGTVASAQRVYSEITGKSWWTENKEVWSVEEDAALLANLQADGSRLRELMETLVHHNVFDESIHSLLCGEKKGIESFFAGEDPAAIALSYVRENQPSNSYELFERTGTGYFLTEEQAQYLLYSICGKQMDFDLSAEDIGITGYIGFGAYAGDSSWDYMEQFSVERINANSWKVRAKDIYSCDWEPSRVVSRVCFTVVKNPDSCFDGYSLTGFEVEEKADTNWWAKIYYDYLITEPEWVKTWVFYANCDIDPIDPYATLLYIDDDTVPEMYINKGSEYGFEQHLLCISNGTVQEYELGIRSYVNIKPYMGFFINTERCGNDIRGHSIYRSIYYDLKNGILTEFGCHEWGDNSELADVYYLSEREVPKEKFVEAIKGYISSEDWEFGDSVYADTFYYMVSDERLLQRLYWWSIED